jgi:cob(I)alamin adenosyltransferase
MVRINRIYTRAGDEGSTRLADGSVLSKGHARIEAGGAVDELNAAIGLTRQHARHDAVIDPLLDRVQNELFDLGADLSTPVIPSPSREALRIIPSQVERLEAEIDAMNRSLAPLNSFVLPGGSALAAHLHMARTICRRAEREVVRLIESGESVNPDSLRYLNRLSDLLFTASRRANADGAEDVLWQPGATR